MSVTKYRSLHRFSVHSLWILWVTCQNWRKMMFTAVCCLYTKISTWPSNSVSVIPSRRKWWYSVAVSVNVLHSFRLSGFFSHCAVYSKISYQPGARSLQYLRLQTLSLSRPRFTLVLVLHYLFCLTFTISHVTMIRLLCVHAEYAMINSIVTRRMPQSYILHA